MAYKPVRNGGLTDDQAERLISILQRVGMVVDRKAMADLIGVPLARLSNFLRTKRAKSAMDEATELSQKLYYRELRRAAYPDDEEDQETAPTSTLSEHEALSLGLSIKERRNMGCYSQDADLKSESDWIKEKDPSITDDEIAKWNRLADGK